jgi:hypothetical protein
MASAASGQVKVSYETYNTLIEYRNQFTPNEKRSTAFNYAAGAFQTLFNPSDATLGIEDGVVVDKQRFSRMVGLFEPVVDSAEEVVCLAKPELSFEPSRLVDKNGKKLSSLPHNMQEGMQETIERLRKVYPKNQSILVATAIMMKIGAFLLPSSWKKSEQPNPAAAQGSAAAAAAPERELHPREIARLQRHYARFQAQQQRQYAASTQRWVGDIYGGARPASD